MAKIQSNRSERERRRRKRSDAIDGNAAELIIERHQRDSLATAPRQITPPSKCVRSPRDSLQIRVPSKVMGYISPGDLSEVCLEFVLLIRGL